MIVPRKEQSAAPAPARPASPRVNPAAGLPMRTRRLMADLLTVPEFGDTTFAFTDLSQENLDMVTQLARRDIAGNNLPAKIEATTDRRAAIA